MVSFDRACAVVESVLAGSAREDILDRLRQSQQLGPNLLRLRDSMQSHVWRAGSRTIDLQRFVPAYDAATRKEGLHAMHDWDGIADHVHPDMIAVDVLNNIASLRGHDRSHIVAVRFEAERARRSAAGATTSAISIASATAAETRRS